MKTGCSVTTNQTQSFGRVINVLAFNGINTIASLTRHGAAETKLRRSQIKGKMRDGRRWTDLEQNISCCVTDSAGVRGDEAGVTSMLEGLVYNS